MKGLGLGDRPDPLQMTTCAGLFGNDRDQRAALRYYEEMAMKWNAPTGVHCGVALAPVIEETPSSKTLLLLTT